MVSAALSYQERWAPNQVQECVELWNLTVEEKDKLLLLQDLIQDIDHWKNDPFEVVRFLKESKFNLKITEHKFRASMQWRKDNNADRILEDYHPPILFNYFPMGVIEGADYNSDPVYIERSGAADTLGLLHRFGKDEMIQQAIWGRELMSRGPWQEKWQRQHNNKIRSFTAILDLKGLNRSHLSPALMPVGQAVTRLVQDNYPGIGKNILIIRAPYIFRFVWNIFKHFIDPHVKDLIEIATEKETEAMLAKYMDISILPKDLIPDQGKGRAVPGYEPIWEGGAVPPATKDDWERRAPLLFYDHGGEGVAKSTGRPQPSEAAFASLADDTNGSFNSTNEVLRTPIHPTTFLASMSSVSVSSASEWETLPKGTPRRNIQQAWTVTPAPMFDLEFVWKKENFDEMANLWKLTQVEQICLEELRDRLADVHHWTNDPFIVVRYFKDGKGHLEKVKKGDLDRIEHKFRKMVTWRVERHMEDYFRQYRQPNPLFHHMPMCILRGTDMDGDPIVLQRVGACDYKSLLRKFGEEGLVDYTLFLRELNSTRKFWKPYEEEAGRRFKQYTVVIDLEGLHTGHLKPGMLHLVRRIVRISQDFYGGGYAKRIILIRAPSVFKLSWAIVRNLFDAQTLEKIQISGDAYLCLLDKYIARAVLPPIICPEEGVGGTMPGYYENIKLEGGRIPKVELKKALDQFSEPIPIFPSEPEAPIYNSRRAPRSPGRNDIDPFGTPIQAKNIMTGYWGNDDDENNADERADAARADASERIGSSIRAFATPEKGREAVSSSIFNW